MFDYRIKRITVKRDDKNILIDPEEFYFLEGLKGKVWIHTREESFSLWGSLREWEYRLRSLCFFRCHLTHIINLSKVDRLSIKADGSAVVRLKYMGHRIPVDADKVNALRATLKSQKSAFNSNSNRLREGNMEEYSNG